VSGGGQWPRWLAASGLVHALLLGVLVLAVGPASRPPATLRARLVTEIKAVAISPSEKETRTAHEVSPKPPAPTPRGKKTRTAVASAPGEKASDASVARPGPGPDSDRGIPAVPTAALPPSGGAKKEEGAPAGPIGEGQAPLSVPRRAARAPEADHTPLEASLAPASLPAQSDAEARGIFVMPAGSSGSGTGRSGVGATDRGVGIGGGAGGAGTGRGGPGSLGGAGPGGGGGALASRGGTGGPGGGEGIADLLRRIRRRIEQAKIYPDAARRQGVQGTVELRFRIAADGSVEAVEIVRSSGSGILDEASQETIRRAGPYPLVRGWIRLPLAYRLDQ